MEGNWGNDTLDGGDGTDTAIFYGPRSAYTVTKNSDGSVTVAGGSNATDGTDTLYDVELFKFNQSGGSYTESELLAPQTPIVIKTIDDLQNINLDLSATYILGNDIDASGFAFSPIGGGFTLRQFTGVLDGKGYKIEGLSPSANAASPTLNIGLFGEIGISGTGTQSCVDERTLLGE